MNLFILYKVNNKQIIIPILTSFIHTRSTPTKNTTYNNTDNKTYYYGGSNYDSLFVRTVAFPVQVAYWIKEVIAPCGTSAPCQLRPEVRRHGRGVLWTGGDPCMTGCLECPLASPVFAQSWSQTATDGAWYSTTALLSGRDRPRCLCVLRLSGSEPKTRRTGSVATSLPSISLPVGARW